MVLATPPESTRRKLNTVQTALVRRISDAIYTVSSSLGADLTALIRRMDRLGWPQGQLQAAIRKLMGAHHGRLEKQLLGLVDDAAGYMDRYLDDLAKIDPDKLKPLPKSAVYWAQQRGPMAAAAQQAVSLVRGRTAGERSIWGAGSPFTETGRLNLSRNLHLLTQHETEEVTRQVLRSIREAKAMGEASRALVQQIPGIGAGEPLPQAARTLAENINRFEKFCHLGNQDSDIRKLKRYLRRIKAGGRVGSGYAELIQDLESGKGAEKALEKFAYWKQRYRAETILNTEGHAACRMRQSDFAQQRPWVVGFIWHMNRGRHRRFLRSKPGKLKKFAGKHCVCEVMDGRRITAEEYRDEWHHGGHPHCCCWFEEVIDRDKLFQVEFTEEAEAWLKGG